MYDKIYRISFIDKEEFIGGDLNAPKWNKCPDKGIESFKLILPYGDKIILSEYEKYNFFIGAMKPVTGGRLTIVHLYLMGCRNDSVTSYRITLISNKNSKHKIGDMTVRQFPFGKEGIGRTSTNGWKKGVV